ncbi:hypothetical protein [Streptacidiphilus carbonis]|nr:hypothetical protein [Streptacidiphilus carbonis]
MNDIYIAAAVVAYFALLGYSLHYARQNSQPSREVSDVREG